MSFSENQIGPKMTSEQRDYAQQIAERVVLQNSQQVNYMSVFVCFLNITHLFVNMRIFNYCWDAGRYISLHVGHTEECVRTKN